MKNFWFIVNKIIDDSDIIIEVIDARFPEDTRNKEIEDKIKKKKKKLIIVLNKADLIPRAAQEFEEYTNFVYVSSLKNLGTTKLRTMIRVFSEKDKVINVGVVGYPNTGKSSLINVLRQKKVAKTAPRAGHTRGVQKIKITKNLFLWDTPGVYPYREADQIKLAMNASMNIDKIKEPDTVAMEVLEHLDHEPVEQTYKVEYTDDYEDLLERIAISLNYYKKGKVPDITRASKKIIQDWQKGNLKKYKSSEDLKKK
jgi:ribosome biogenesis GTPase A